jgi:hypothetical protein
MSSTIPAASMNSTPSKVFTVIVMNCENPSHGRKIAGLLRASFPHRPGHTTADEPSTDFSIMVKADSPASVRTAISSALGKARAAFAEMTWWSEIEATLRRAQFLLHIFITRQLVQSRNY